jgi:ubiquitin
MVSVSNSPAVSITPFLTTSKETPAGSASGPTKQDQSPESHSQKYRAGIGAVTGLLILSALLAAWATPSAAAEPLPLVPTGPDQADLRYYFDCSNEASMRLMSFDEAVTCAGVYTRIKLAFLRDVDLDDYEGLPPQVKAAANLEAYRRYLEWRLENPAEIDAMTNAPFSSSTLAEN